MTGEELSRELDRRLGGLGLSERATQRWIDAPYVALVVALFAVGHARLRNPARARALAASARQQHGHMGSQGRAWLLAALLARVDQASAQGPLDLALPDEIENRLAVVEQYWPGTAAHYRALRLLGGAGPRLVGAPLATLDEIERAIDDASGDRVRVLVEVLAALVGFGEEAMPLVARASAEIVKLPAPRIAARAAAVQVAAHHGWGELVHEQLPALLDELDDTPAAFFALSSAARALRRLAMTAELRRLIDRAAKRIGGALSTASLQVATLEHREPGLDQREDVRFLLAGAATLLGDRSALDVLARAAELRISSPKAALVLHGRLCIAYGHGAAAHALRALTAAGDPAAMTRRLGSLDALLAMIDAQIWAITMLG